MLRLSGFEEQPILFPVDPGRSHLTGMILSEDPGRIYWTIMIHCAEVAIPHPEEHRVESEEDFYTADCWLEISELSADLGHWRELSGNRFTVAFEADDVHPILPDNPGNFNFNEEHYVPNRNRIAFGERAGRTFPVRWDCVPERFAGDDNGSSIEVSASVPLLRLEVWFRDPASLTIEAAERVALRYAGAADLDRPTRYGENWVQFPIRPDLE